MKLYFMPGACSLAPHIALREAALPFTLVEVDYQSRRTACGRDFREINPKGYVPALLLGDGQLLTEVPVMLQYIDSMVPSAALLPPSGMRRYRALEWLNYVATEVHKSFSPLFRPTTPGAFLKPGREHLSARLTTIERHLKGSQYLTGPDFCLADAYLFTVCRWLDDQHMSLARWPALQRHFDEIATRRSVRDAMAREGITTSHPDCRHTAKDLGQIPVRNANRPPAADLA